MSPDFFTCCHKLIFGIHQDLTLFLKLFNRLFHLFLSKLHWNRLLLYHLQILFLKLMDRHFHRYLPKLPSICLRLYHLQLMLLILDQRLRHYLPKLHWNGYQ